MFSCKVVVGVVFISVAHCRSEASTPAAPPFPRAAYAVEPDGTQSGLSMMSRPLSVPPMSINAPQTPNLTPEY